MSGSNLRKATDEDFDSSPVTAISEDNFKKVFDAHDELAGRF